jgi:hypothetical protein
MEEKKWALRRSPTVPQEVVQLSDGRWVGVVNSVAFWWPEDGLRNVAARGRTGSTKCRTDEND